MKKLILTISALVSLAPASAFAISASPLTANLSNAPTYQVLYECDTLADTFQAYAFAPNGDAAPNHLALDCDQTPDYFFTDTGGNGFFYYEQAETVVGTYTLIEAESGADCGTIASCEADPTYVNTIEIELVQGLTEAIVLSSFGASVIDISTIAGGILLVVLALIGILIGAGWGWRFTKRHIGAPINGPYSNDLKAAMRIRANKRFMDATDE